jgi:hypothetical protein
MRRRSGYTNGIRPAQRSDTGVRDGSARRDKRKWRHSDGAETTWNNLAAGATGPAAAGAPGPAHPSDPRHGATRGTA